MRRAGVIGYPARHSLSPALHGAWLDAAGIEGTYEAVETPAEAFAAAVRERFGAGWTGFSVTMPHKRAAFEIAEARSDTARALGVANLIYPENGRIRADSTDGEGFLYGLARQAPDLEIGGARVLILGAGGAAAAVAHAVAGAGATPLIANRSRDKAEALAGQTGGASVPFPPAPESFVGVPLIVNATSMGMADGPPVPEALDFAQAEPGAVFYDLIYKPLTTPMMQRAAAAGLKTVDGLDMLIGQARPHFQVMFEADPPDIDVRAILLQRIGEAK